MKILFNIAIIKEDKLKQCLYTASRQALSFHRMILQKGPFFVIQQIVSMEWDTATHLLHLQDIFPGLGST